MNTKQLRFFGQFLGVITAMFVGAANAQSPFNGTMGVSLDPFATETPASFSGSSLTLSPFHIVTGGATGTFLAEVPVHSELTAYTNTITGLSTSPVSVNITDFFIFSATNTALGSSATIPTNRFAFNLLTLTDGGGGFFTGTGTFVDSSALYADTPGTFTLSFSGPGTYSFTMAAVPEPTALSLLAAGLLTVVTFRRPKA